MTTDHHNPLDYGAEATSDAINSPLGQLDAAIGTGASTTKPMFLAYASGNIEDVTGDGTEYKVVFDEEVFDQVSNYNTSTGEFTASVTGKYIFNAYVTVTGLTESHSEWWIRLRTTLSPTDRICWGRAIDFMGAVNGEGPMSVQAILDMEADDACYVEIMVDGDTKVVDVIGDDPDNLVTYFSGGLLA